MKYIVFVDAAQNVLRFSVTDLVITADGIQVNVKNVDQISMANFYQAINVPKMALSEDPIEDVSNWLVSDAGTLSGGIITNEENVEFTAKKLEMRMQVKKLRDKYRDGGIEINGMCFETDAESRLNISGAVSMASILSSRGDPFAMEWRLSDDVIVNLSANDMIEIGMILALHVSQCQTRKNQLDELINSAEFLEDLEATDITAGWPNNA